MSNEFSKLVECNKCGQSLYDHEKQFCANEDKGEFKPTPPKPVEPRRQARIICDATGCGEWNCDDCHPETQFTKPVEAPWDIEGPFICRWCDKAIFQGSYGQWHHRATVATRCDRVAEPKPAPLSVEMPEPLVSDEYVNDQSIFAINKRDRCIARELQQWRKWGAAWNAAKRSRGER